MTSKFEMHSSLLPQSQVFHKHYLSHLAQFYSFRLEEEKVLKFKKTANLGQDHTKARL